MAGQSVPLDEDVEQSWLHYNDKFDREIYPLLFESRGYTKGEANIIWMLSKLENAVLALNNRLESF